MKTQHEQRIEAIRQFREVWLLGVLRKNLNLFIFTFGVYIGVLIILSAPSITIDTRWESIGFWVMTITNSLYIIFWVKGSIQNHRKILRECKRLGITYKEWKAIEKNSK